jgi:chromosome segregation ATPase
MSDLLNKLGSKTNSVDGASKAPAPQAPKESAVSSAEINRGDDLLSKAGVKGSEMTTNPTSVTSRTSSAESGHSPTSASGTEEPTGGQTNPEGWTTDSALKEVKKLREENKAYRIKHLEQLDKIKAESEARIDQERSEKEALIDAKKELDRLKADQEDKKRDLSEKLAHREARLAETQAVFEAREKAMKEKLSAYESKMQEYEVDRQAELQVYKSRLDEELGKIPEKFKEYANLLVKGAGDSRDGLIAISEAKLRGMFEDRTVIINHSVPGAHDGARASNERLAEADRERRNRMSPSQKVGEALKAIKSGTPNPAFKTK